MLLNSPSSSKKPVFLVELWGYKVKGSWGHGVKRLWGLRGRGIKDLRDYWVIGVIF